MGKKDNGERNAALDAAARRILEKWLGAQDGETDAALVTRAVTALGGDTRVSFRTAASGKRVVRLQNAGLWIGMGDSDLQRVADVYVKRETTMREREKFPTRFPSKPRRKR